MSTQSVSRSEALTNYFQVPVIAAHRNETVDNQEAPEAMFHLEGCRQPILTKPSFISYYLICTAKIHFRIAYQKETIKLMLPY